MRVGGGQTQRAGCLCPTSTLSTEEGIWDQPRHTWKVPVNRRSKLAAFHTPHRVSALRGRLLWPFYSLLPSSHTDHDKTRSRRALHLLSWDFYTPDFAPFRPSDPDKEATCSVLVSGCSKKPPYIEGFTQQTLIAYNPGGWEVSPGGVSG